MKSKEVFCTRCIMSNKADKKIIFDATGVCHHCHRYDELIDSRVVKEHDREDALKNMVAKIKSSGKNKEYDCIIGVSGGVDSTYVAYLTKELGLRPLAVHLDNGWNSELAVKNIEKTLSKLDIDLYTRVVNWGEFKDLQLSFLKASTPDGEIPSDHAINALLWQEASKRGIKYILSGMNFITESISVPDWAYGHTDWRYISNVHKCHGTKKLSTYPHFSYLYLFYVNILKGVRTVSILNYVDYHKENAMKLLEDKLDWVYYGGKHYESTYTKFFQSYVLPKKFGIDKRYGHLSDLINAGQITREEALDDIKCSPYPDNIEDDLAYVLKKFGLSQDDFEQIMNAPIKSFRNYKNSYAFLTKLKVIVNKLRLLGLYPK
ncbi:N-acetyl sugar amidotransferase [Aliivibrio salmonicida]|uniref:N-acetyl sugar amidotransferase n=1 Tax=Aliivibrio salmonicida TaxID=40269 RepID=UPI00406C1318